MQQIEMLLIMIIISFFNKHLTLNNIKIQNDGLTKEMIMGKGIKSLSTIGGIKSSGLIIFSYIYPDILSRNAGSVAMGASTMLSRVNTLVNVGYGEELDNDPRSSFANSRNTMQEEYINQCSCDFVNEEMGILKRKGRKVFNQTIWKQWRI